MMSLNWLTPFSDYWGKMALRCLRVTHKTQVPRHRSHSLKAECGGGIVAAWASCGSFQFLQSETRCFPRALRHFLSKHRSFSHFVSSADAVVQENMVVGRDLIGPGIYSDSFYISFVFDEEEKAKGAAAPGLAELRGDPQSVTLCVLWSEEGSSGQCVA